MARIISLEEVKKHRRKSSVWIIIHNDVYDVTNFLTEHPGGEDSLLDVAGKDGSREFEDVGHSDDARELLKKYKIGSLNPEDRTSVVLPCCKSSSKKKASSPRSSKCSICSAASCPHLPKMIPPEKSWRTFDGPASSKPVAPKSSFKTPTSPKTEKRVQSITVPRKSEPRPRGYPCNESSKLKWALVALAGALVIGVVVKKYLASK